MDEKILTTLIGQDEDLDGDEILGDDGDDEEKKEEKEKDEEAEEEEEVE